MIDQNKKRNDYPRQGTESLNKDDQKQAQSDPRKSEHDNLGNAYGGKLPKRELQVHELNDNQISDASAFNNEKQLTAARGNAPKK